TELHDTWPSDDAAIVARLRDMARGLAAEASEFEISGAERIGVHARLARGNHPLTPAPVQAVPTADLDELHLDLSNLEVRLHPDFLLEQKGEHGDAPPPAVGAHSDAEAVTTREGRLRSGRVVARPILFEAAPID